MSKYHIGYLSHKRRSFTLLILLFLLIIGFLLHRRREDDYTSAEKQWHHTGKVEAHLPTRTVTHTVIPEPSSQPTPTLEATSESAPETSPSSSSSTQPFQPLAIPELENFFQRAPHAEIEDPFCRYRFGPAYLEDFRDHAFQYCTPNSRSEGEADSMTRGNSRLLCFHAHAREDLSSDSFCLAQNVHLDVATGHFVVSNCNVRKPRDRSMPAVTRLKKYWYETGPSYIIEKFIRIEPSIELEPTEQQKEEEQEEEDADDDYSVEHAAIDPDAPPRFLILLKREGTSNLWHSMMEIWAMTMSIDVLRIASHGVGEQPHIAKKSNTPLFRFPDDLERTQVVIANNKSGDGEVDSAATLDLWRLFAHRPTVYLQDILDDARQPDTLARASRQQQLLPPGNGPLNLILPLPGGSNPLWQNDWQLRPCGSSVFNAGTPAAAPLLHLFVQRVLVHLKLEPDISHAAEIKPHNTIPLTYIPSPSPAPPIVVTFVDRRGSRRLLGQEALIDRLRQNYPADRVTIEVVDMAALSLAEQITIVRKTDVLAGVHGAGLTHIMFMRSGGNSSSPTGSGGGAVVEIQPAKLHYRGFRNLAHMRGQQYFSAQAERVRPDEARGEAEENKIMDKEVDWQSGNVRIEEERFLVLMDAAIKSQYNKGQRNWDIV